MKNGEAESVLLSAFDHKPDTRAEFFHLEAVKSGYSLSVFFNELMNAYQQMEKFVNSKDFSAQCQDSENGEWYYQLNTIQIDHFTNGRELDNENIIELIEPLSEFKKMLGIIDSPSDIQIMYEAEMKEFCKDMPHETNYNRANDPNFIPIDLYPGHYFSVGKTGVISMQIRIILLLTKSDIRETKRLFEQWYILHIDKQWFIKNLRKFIIDERQGNLYNTLNVGRISSEQVELLSAFIDEHKESIANSKSEMDYNIKNPLLIDALKVWENNSFLKKFRTFLLIVDYLSNQNKVSDDMINDFLLGFSLIPKSIKQKDEVLGAQIDNLTEPVTSEIRKFLNSDYLKFNVERNIDTGEGLEKLNIDGWEIPIIPGKIIRYIKETKSPFMTSRDIRDAKLGFIKMQKFEESEKVKKSLPHSNSVNMSNDVNKGLSLDIGMSLNTISENLKKEFPSPGFNHYAQIYSFVKKMISVDPLISNMNYLNFESAFLDEIKSDPDKRYFLKREIKEVSDLLAQALVHSQDSSKIIKDLSYLIIKVKEDVLKTYFIKYLLDGDYEVFVNVFFSFDLIKYLRFLRGERVTQLINEPLPVDGKLSGIKIVNKKTKDKPIAGLAESDKSNSAKTVYSEKKILKVSDFLPLYGYLWSDNYTLTIKGVVYSMNDLFEDQDIEISDIQLGWLYDYDRESFISRLSHLHPESYVIEFLRNTLDEYISEEGDPVYWITQTINDIELNYSGYPAVHRGVMLKHLMEWLDFYLKANKIFVKDGPNDSDDSGADTTPQSPSNSLIMKEYLSESANEYITKYNTRLNQFVSEYEAIEIDFIDRESEFWENCLYDIEHSEASHDGFSSIGIKKYEILYELIMQIGYDKFHYSTLRKLEFLADRKKNHIQSLDSTTINPDRENKLNFENHDSSKVLVDIFINPNHKDLCIGILKKLSPAVINAHNQYIPGSKKGIFPLWIEILRDHNPNPIIKPLHALVYKDWLNSIFVGLDLTKDASEFRKSYPSLEKKNIPSDLKLFLSQLSLPED